MNNYIFWGTDDFSIEVLKTLLNNNYKPIFCITQPDRPKGRKLILTPPPIKIFCEEKDIKVLQPNKLSDLGIEFWDSEFDFFVVASYGKIIPKEIVDKPKFGTLNIHPSLLPKHRGSSPIETVILNDEKKTGVTIMLMDEKMDHGPIISQKEVVFEEWPSKIEVRNKLAKISGEMLLEIIPNILNIKTKEQKHSDATFTKMVQKSDGEINLEEYFKTDTRNLYLKYLAYTPWPGLFFFVEKNNPSNKPELNQKIRIKITEAILKDGKFIIQKLIPEGKSEMSWESFENGYLK